MDRFVLGLPKTLSMNLLLEPPTQLRESKGGSLVFDERQLARNTQTSLRRRLGQTNKAYDISLSVGPSTNKGQLKQNGSFC